MSSVKSFFMHIKWALSLNELGFKSVVTYVIVFHVHDQDHIEIISRSLATRHLFFLHLKDCKLSTKQQNVQPKRKIEYIREIKKKLKIVRGIKWRREIENLWQDKDTFSSWLVVFFFNKWPSSFPFIYVFKVMLLTCDRAHSRSDKKLFSHEGVFKSICIIRSFIFITRVFILIRFGETCWKRIESLIFSSFTPSRLWSFHRCGRQTALSIIPLKVDLFIITPRKNTTQHSH